MVLGNTDPWIMPTTWSLLCDGGSGGGRWHHRRIQGGRGVRTSIRSWSGPDVPWRKQSWRSYQHLCLPWTPRTVPPSLRCSRTNPWGDCPKLGNKNLIPGGYIHLHHVFLPNIVTTHLQVIRSLIPLSLSFNWSHRKLSGHFQARRGRGRRRNNKKWKTHDSIQAEGVSLTLSLGDVC